MSEVSYKNLVELVRKATSLSIQAAVDGRYGGNYHSNMTYKEASLVWKQANIIAEQLDLKENSSSE